MKRNQFKQEFLAKMGKTSKKDEVRKEILAKVGKLSGHSPICPETKQGAGAEMMEKFKSVSEPHAYNPYITQEATACHGFAHTNALANNNNSALFDIGTAVWIIDHNSNTWRSAIVEGHQGDGHFYSYFPPDNWHAHQDAYSPHAHPSRPLQQSSPPMMNQFPPPQPPMPMQHAYPVPVQPMLPQQNAYPPFSVPQAQPVSTERVTVDLTTPASNLNAAGNSVNKAVSAADKETKMAENPVPILLIQGDKKKGRKWPREFPDGGLSALVEDVFTDLKGEDYHLEYADEVWIEDDGDWEMALEFFDSKSFERLELNIKKNVQEEKAAPSLGIENATYAFNQADLDIFDEDDKNSKLSCTVLVLVASKKEFVIKQFPLHNFSENVQKLNQHLMTPLNNPLHAAQKHEQRRGCIRFDCSKVSKTIDFDDIFFEIIQATKSMGVGTPHFEFCFENPTHQELSDLDDTCAFFPDIETRRVQIDTDSFTATNFDIYGEHRIIKFPNHEDALQFHQQVDCRSEGANHLTERNQVYRVFFIPDAIGAKILRCGKSPALAPPKPLIVQEMNAVFNMSPLQEATDFNLDMSPKVLAKQEKLLRRQYHYPYEDQIDDYPDRGQTFASYAENDPFISPNRQRLPEAFQDGLAHHERNYESQRKHEPNRHDYVSREYVLYPSPHCDFYESVIPEPYYWREHSVSPEPYYSPKPYHSPRSRGGHTSQETRSRGRSRGRGKLRSRGRGRLKRDISPQRRSISPVHVSRGSGNSRGARTRGRGSRRCGR